MIEPKLNNGQLTSDDLQELVKTKYFSFKEFQKTFGKLSAGECDACIRTYNPTTEFVFARLYLSVGGSGDGTLMWDVIEHELEETKAQLRAKFMAVEPVTLEETLTLLLQLKLDEYDKTQIQNKTVQLSSIPDILKRQKCAQCGQDGDKACAGCNIVHYCGRDCSVAAWNSGHKAACKRLKMAREKFLK